MPLGTGAKSSARLVKIAYMQSTPQEPHTSQVQTEQCAQAGGLWEPDPPLCCAVCPATEEGGSLICAGCCSVSQRADVQRQGRYFQITNPPTKTALSWWEIYAWRRSKRRFASGMPVLSCRDLAALKQAVQAQEWV